MSFLFNAFHKKSNLYLRQYKKCIMDFGKALGLRGSSQQNFVFNPGVGGDLHNLLLLTEPGTPIFMTDIVPLDYKQLQRKPFILSAEEKNEVKNFLEMSLKGESDVADYWPMHLYFIHRLSKLGYSVKSVSKEANNVIHLSVKSHGILRNLYYLQVNHTHITENDRLLEILKETIPSSRQLIYFQKALEPDVSETLAWRSFLRQLKINFSKSVFYIDGAENSYPHQNPIEISLPAGQEKKRFCYDNKMWPIIRIPNEQELLTIALQENGALLNEPIRKLKNYFNDPLFMELLRVFSNSRYEELKQTIYNINQFEKNLIQFKTEEEFLSFRNNICNSAEHLDDTYERFTKLSVKEQIDKNLMPIILKYNHRSNRSANVLWERIHLGEAFLKLFPKEEDFWNSQQSPIELLHVLKIQNEELKNISLIVSQNKFEK